MTFASASRDSSLCFVRRRPRAAALFRLYCYPHAGGSAGSLVHGARALGSEIEIVGIQPPGRERRFLEAPWARLDPLLEELVAAFATGLDSVPFGLMGNSLGAMVVFELARALRRERLPLPRALWVAGRRAPHLPSTDPIDPSLPVAELLSDLDRVGSGLKDLPPDVIGTLLPALRGDLALAATYAYTDEPPLPCPIITLAGADDTSVSAEEIAAWSRHTERPGAGHVFPGGHFFFLDEWEAIVAAVAADIASLAPPQLPD